MKIIKYLLKNDKKNTTYLNMWGLSKQNLEVNVYWSTFIRKQEHLKINKLSIYIKKVGKQQTKSKVHTKILSKKGAEIETKKEDQWEPRLVLLYKPHKQK